MIVESRSCISVEERDSYHYLSGILIGVLGVVFFFGGQVRIAGVLMVPLYLLLKKKSLTFSKNVLLLFLFLYPIFLGTLQIEFFREGYQGIDFALFSQVIFQIATSFRFSTSLIGNEWLNFLTHHCSPYLFLVGLIRKLGGSSQGILIGAHVFSVVMLTLAICKIFLLYSTKHQRWYLFASAALLLPALRIGLSWETHDEVLALPLLIWSLYFHLKGNHYVKIILLLPVLLFKETLGLNIFGLCTFYGIDSKRERALSFGVGLLGIVTFILYTQVLPHWLWTPTFNGITRISTPSEFFSWPALSKKFIWAVKSFLPIFPYLFFHNRRTFRWSLLLLLSVGYNLVAILVTNFPNMYDPYNYYSITPVLISYIAFVLPVVSHPQSMKGLFWSGVIISLIGGRVGLPHSFWEGLLGPSAYSELQEKVGLSDVIIADDRTTSLFSEYKEVRRLYHANDTPFSFDKIVLRKGEEFSLSSYLLTHSIPCGETPRYFLRCRTG